MNAESYQTAREFIREHGLATSINTITEYDGSEPVYINLDERFGDPYFYTDSEIPGMIEGCDWKCSVSDVENSERDEVPGEVFELLSEYRDDESLRKFTRAVRESETVEELLENL